MMSELFMCPLCEVEVPKADFYWHFKVFHPDVEIWSGPYWQCPCGWRTNTNTCNGFAYLELMKHIIDDPDHFRTAMVEQALLRNSP